MADNKLLTNAIQHLRDARADLEGTIFVGIDSELEKNVRDVMNMLDREIEILELVLSDLQ